MTAGTGKNGFGCAECWPDGSPEAAWERRKTRVWDFTSIEESHYSVDLLRCVYCGQQFVHVFTETIDWREGNDPMAWMTLPISGEEAAALKEQGEVSESFLNALGKAEDPAGRQRVSLFRDWPSEGEIRIAWWAGFYVGPHD